MKKGFTLIELIVVIAIIAIMGAVIAPNAFKSIEKAKIASTVQDLNSIKTAAAAYFTDTSAWPTAAENLTADSGLSGWDGPYLDKWPAGQRWSGSNYTWTSQTGTAFGASSGERFITVNGLVAGVADKLDKQLDPGNNGTSGSVRYNTGETLIQYLVSRDAAVN